MSATPSIVIGKEGFGIKNGNLLGYYRADDGIYVARQFTATRGGGTNGTFVNSSGLIEVAASPNLPRIDFSSGSKAVLIEPSAQNLVQRSEEFNDSYWAKSYGTVTQDQTTAPNGLTTADKYVVTNGQPSNSPIIRTFTFAINTTYTLSLFVKKADYDTASIRLYTIETGFATNFFNLASGTATNNQIQYYGNGWYRVWASFTTAATATNGQIQLIRDAEVRDGVAGIFIWGAQLETGAVATTYIPTTTGPITRNADAITLANASEYIGQTEGTVYMEVDLRNLSTGIFRRLINVTDGTLNNRLQINTTDTNSRLQLLLFQGGVTQVSIVSPSAFSGVVKLAAAYAVNDIAFYVNGVQIGTDTSASIPACSQVNLGTNVDGASAFNDRIRAAALYTTRLSNAQLIDMTWQ